MGKVSGEILLILASFSNLKTERNKNLKTYIFIVSNNSTHATVLEN